MSVASLVHAQGGPSAGAAVSAGPIDTTGATLIVVTVGASDAPTFTDSKSNSWTSFTVPTQGGGLYWHFFYKINPTTDAAHTFDLSSGHFCSLCVQAFTGTGTLDSQNATGAGGTATTATAESITPSQDNCLVLSMCGFSSGGTQQIENETWTIDEQTTGSGAGYGSLIAYQIQTTATARNPTITFNSNSDYGMVNAAFKGASVAPSNTDAYVDDVPMLYSVFLGG